MAPQQTLLQRLDHDLKNAMRAREAVTLATLRQVKSRIQEAVNKQTGAPAGDPEDAFVQEIIAAYCKSLDKASAEMARAGAKSQALRDSYAAECSFLQRYLPAKLSADQLRALASAAAEDLGVRGAAHVGRVLGTLMKRHPNQVDAGVARAIIQDVLGA